MAPVNFLRAWLIKRACIPMTASPISPSSSARGTRAATESTTTTSIAPERIKVSVISKACSPVSGWDIRRLSRSTPRISARVGSRACSASTKAHCPPFFCASAITDKANVVLPEASGPKISVIRPLGSPPTPKARSTAMEPVGITSIVYFWPSPPKRIMEPFPYCFSIWSMARRIAASF